MLSQGSTSSSKLLRKPGQDVDSTELWKRTKTPNTATAKFKVSEKDEGHLDKEDSADDLTPSSNFKTQESTSMDRYAGKSTATSSQLNPSDLDNDDDYVVNTDYTNSGKESTSNSAYRSSILSKIQTQTRGATTPIPSSSKSNFTTLGAKPTGPPSSSTINFTSSLLAKKSSSVSAAYGGSGNLSRFIGSTNQKVDERDNDLDQENEDTNKGRNLLNVTSSSHFDGHGIKDGEAINLVNPQRTLSKELKTLVNNKEFSDVVFKVEDTPLYAHRAVLAARCTRLQQMFSNLSKEQQTRPVPEIPIPNVRFDVFLAMMEFLYSDSIEQVTLEMCLDLLGLAKQFELELLRALCERILEQSINVENVGWIFSGSDAYKATRLRDLSVNFIVKNFDMVSKTKSFEELSRELILEIIKKR